MAVASARPQGSQSRPGAAVPLTAPSSQANRRMARPATVTATETVVAGTTARLTGTRRPPRNEIGARLYITAGTVKTHLASIQQKLGVTNRVAIAAWAWSTGHSTPRTP